MAVPHTRTRLKGFVTLATYPGGLYTEDPQTIINNLGAFVTIGSAQSLTIKQDRETNNYRREFKGSEHPIPAETYPGLPVYGATMERVDLYDTNLLEAFGVDDVNIVAQYKPLVIQVIQPVPEDKDGNPLTINGKPLKGRTYILPGCWFASMPIEFNIEDADQKFVPSVDLMVKTVYSL